MRPLVGRASTALVLAAAVVITLALTAGTDAGIPVEAPEATRIILTLEGATGGTRTDTARIAVAPGEFRMEKLTVAPPPDDEKQQERQRQRRAERHARTRD